MQVIIGWLNQLYSLVYYLLRPNPNVSKRLTLLSGARNMPTLSTTKISFFCIAFCSSSTLEGSKQVLTIRFFSQRSTCLVRSLGRRVLAIYTCYNHFTITIQHFQLQRTQSSHITIQFKQHCRNKFRGDKTERNVTQLTRFKESGEQTFV